MTDSDLITQFIARHGVTRCPSTGNGDMIERNGVIPLTRYGGFPLWPIHFEGFHWQKRYRKKGSGAARMANDQFWAERKAKRK